MKRRITKKGKFILRRQKRSDKSFSYRESIRLAYFEMVGKPAYIVRKREVNNVIYVGRDKVEAIRLTDFLNR